VSDNSIMQSSFASDFRDLKEMLSQPVTSNTLARWERKLQSNPTGTTTPCKTPRRASKTPGTSGKSTSKLGKRNRTPLTSKSGKKRNMFGTPCVSASSTTRSAKKRTPLTKTGNNLLDRFIPNRDSMNTGISLNSVTNENKNPESSNAAFTNQLAQSLFQGDDVNSKILSFKNKAPKPTETFTNNLRVLYTQNKLNPKVSRGHRHIPSAPERILDAPDMLDDYYLNLLDWSVKGILAVALGPCIYLWDATTGNIDLLCEAEEDVCVTSVSWMMDGSYLAVGTSNNDVQMWDVVNKKQVRSMKGHQARVGALAWNNHILSSGSRDSCIFHHDVRVADHHVGTLRGHQQEVCGLKWSPDGTQLASGGNDNVCMIWDASLSTTSPKFTFTESQAAVKALAWCPWEKNLLATGSGTADRHIRFYNTQTGDCVNQIDTESQVTSLIWSPHQREIVSSHGFSENQLIVWKYPTMTKITELTGHTSRILHTSLSADGTSICTAAADETLRFWQIWEPVAEKKSARAATSPKRRRLLDCNIR